MVDSAFKAGDRCDRYEIVRLVAAGGMGEVYEAVHAFTRRTVALKCLQLRHNDKPDLLERMRLEAVVLCGIRHPNIVTVYDAGITDDGTIWIAMELLVGRTLRELVHAVGRLPVDQALHVACEIADGIEAAHATRVVHRDLKPENVFITSASKVKVLDLGAAKFYGYGLKTTDRMRTIGTPAYMSPEHIQGLRIDGRADIYALGLIVYEMLAGHHAFAQAGSNENMPSSLEIGTLQLFATPPPLPEIAEGVPRYVWTIVERALAKDREARHATMGELSAALRAARKRWVKETTGGADARWSSAPAGPIGNPSIVVAPAVAGALPPAPPRPAAGREPPKEASGAVAAPAALASLESGAGARPMPARGAPPAAAAARVEASPVERIRNAIRRARPTVVEREARSDAPPSSDVAAIRSGASGAGLGRGAPRMPRMGLTAALGIGIFVGLLSTAVVVVVGRTRAAEMEGPPGAAIAPPEASAAAPPVARAEESKAASPEGSSEGRPPVDPAKAAAATSASKPRDEPRADRSEERAEPSSPTKAAGKNEPRRARGGKAVRPSPATTVEALPAPARPTAPEAVAAAPRGASAPASVEPTPTLPSSGL